MPQYKTITILHMSDLQFGKNNRFCHNDVSTVEGGYKTLLKRLVDDLRFLKEADQIIPDAIVVSGDLTETGSRSEFAHFHDFMEALLLYTQISSQLTAIVPGNHDINWHACQAYFSQRAAAEKDPKYPYWPKWSNYVSFFNKFYAAAPSITFTEALPWTLFKCEALKLVIAGLNSTIAESHRPDDHYGYLDEPQLEWFSREMSKYESQRWFRLCVVHHNVERGAVDDNENLRDREELRRILAPHVNCILHGHTHTSKVAWLGSKVPVLSTGSTAVKPAQRPPEVPNQYEIIRFSRTGFVRVCRQYAPDRKQWIGDTRASSAGDDWRQRERVAFKASEATFVAQRKPRASTSLAPQRPVVRSVSQINYPDLLSAAENADDVIAKLFSGSSVKHAVLVHRAQNAIASDEFAGRRLGSDLYDLLTRIIDSDTSLDEDHIKPLLRVDVDSHFTNICFESAGGKLVVAKPRLVWDCSCFMHDDSGNYIRLPGKEKTCYIHRHGVVAREVTRIFQSGVVQFCYDGLTFLWKNGDNFFPPSCDSFYLVEDMEAAGAFDGEISSVVDIGSGTGFLGFVALRKCPGARKLGLVEWVTTPLIYSCISFSINRKIFLTPVELSPHLLYDVGWNFPPDGPYDLALSNPPYLPLIDRFPSVMANATSGTVLLTSVIRHKLSLAKRAYVSFSHIAMPEAVSAANECGCKLSPIGNPRRIPFRNVYALKDRSYVQELVHSRGLEHCPEDPFYPFWHTVQSFEIRGQG